MKRSRLKTVVGISMALLLIATNATAQMEMMHVQCQVTINNNGSNEYRAVQYASFRSMAKAQNAYNTLKAALTAEDQLGATGLEFETAREKLGIVWKQTQPNGMFRLSVFEGQGVLLYDQEGRVLRVFEIHRGQTQYTEVLKPERLLREIVSISKFKRRGPTIKAVPSTDTGYETRFNINLALDEGWVKNSSRLIIQPMAIDCQTEDTVAYLQPIIFEGKAYHRLQERRMAFDYHHKDPVAVGYTTSQTLRDMKPFAFDTTVVFRKPDKDKIYKGLYVCAIEDLHRVTWQNDGSGSGSCLAFRPFKFLDFSVASASIPLTDEFRVAAESNYVTTPRNLMLKFEVGTDKLTNDSTNNVELNTLYKELRSYGDLLQNVTIQGAASPEGSYELNKGLADKRAAVALKMLRRNLPSDVNIGRLDANVFTWDDVVKELESLGDAEQTSIVRSAVANNKGNEVFGILKGLPFYDTAIRPILERQRIMKCSYTYERQHVMDAGEAVQEYYYNKKEYLAGRKKFSEGDYYNLYSALKDSAEQDTLTMIAYKHLSSLPAYENLPMSPYVANRMALLNIRRGTPDTKVLSPFIDLSRSKNDLRVQIDQFNSKVVNRHEILLNQAICYFQEQKLDTASYILDRLPNSKDTERLRMFMTFERDYIRYLNGECTPEEAEAARQAEIYVLNVNAENRAIIYSELRTSLNLNREDAEVWVDKLSDNNPKKWYLKGMLWSDEAGREPAVDAIDDGFRELSDAEYMELQQNHPDELSKYNEAYNRHMEASAEAMQDRTPYFLAYFQHSFDLEPKYKRNYFNEGNVSDEIRKKYAYNKKDIPAYRKKFAMLKAQADRKAASTTANDTNEATKQE